MNAHTHTFTVGDEVTIGGGKAVYTVSHVWEDGDVRIIRTIGVGRLGRHGRTTTLMLGSGWSRPVSDLHLVAQEEN